MSFHVARQKPATGSVRGHQKSPRIVVSFEWAMFERIAGEAARRRIPFAEVVRERMILAYQVVPAPSADTLSLQCGHEASDAVRDGAGRERSDRVGEPISSPNSPPPGAE